MVDRVWVRYSTGSGQRTVDRLAAWWCESLEMNKTSQSEEGIPMDTKLRERVVELSKLRLRYWSAWQLVKSHAKAAHGDRLDVKIESYRSECRTHLREAQQKLDMMLHEAGNWDILPKVPEDLESGFEADLTQAAAVILKLEGKAGEVTGLW
jgi:hypothetical protein